VRDELVVVALKGKRQKNERKKGLGKPDRRCKKNIYCYNSPDSVCGSCVIIGQPDRPGIPYILSQITLTLGQSIGKWYKLYHSLHT